jgi:hypothetical protein
MPKGATSGERRGGRQQGTPNKKTVALQTDYEALGCDSIEDMARLAMDETAELKPTCTDV